MARTAALFRFRNSLVLLLSLILAPLLLGAQTAGDPVVQAVLFYSPTCPHCHQVITELLLPMEDKYGGQLQIVGIDTSIPAGQALYGTAVEYFKIPETRRGVPTLIVSNTILVGSLEIPEQFPGIVEEGLKAGGIGWPDIPDLALVIPDLPPAAGPAAPRAVSTPETAPAALEEDAQAEVDVKLSPAATAVPPVKQLQEADMETSSAASTEEPPADPLGFALAWLVLIGMAAAVVYAVRQIVVSQPPQTTALSLSTAPKVSWALPLLALLGLGVALYLSYVEVNQVTAICGPIGECNIVQSSSYARLFSVPIAVWGVLSYVAILALWAGQQFLPPRAASLCYSGLALLTFFGVLFSIYLTLLELFAIKAICLWCLTSAVIMTLLLLLVTRSASSRSPYAELAA